MPQSDRFQEVEDDAAWEMSKENEALDARSGETRRRP